MYFIIETKGNIDHNALRPTESYKIGCGKKHLKALTNKVQFKETDDYKDFKENII